MTEFISVASKTDKGNQLDVMLRSQNHKWLHQQERKGTYCAKIKSGKLETKGPTHCNKYCTPGGKFIPYKGIDEKFEQFYTVELNK